MKSISFRRLEGLVFTLAFATSACSVVDPSSVSPMDTRDVEVNSTVSDMSSGSTPKSDAVNNHEGRDQSIRQARYNSAQTDGSSIHVTLDSTRAQRFAVAEVSLLTFAVAQRLPGRVIASAVASSDLASPLLIFETPDLSQSYSEFLRARIELARTRRIAARLEALSKNGAVAGKDVDDAEVEVLQAESRLREDEAHLREMGLDPRILAELSPGTALVSADLAESHISMIRVGSSASVTLASLPGGPTYGRVLAVSDAVDPQTRTARVMITVPHLSQVRPGMFTSVEIKQDAVQAPAVPLSAIIQADARTFVFVRTSPFVFERREIAIGPDNGTMVAVMRGVRQGEQVVIANAILLKGLSFGY